MMRFPIGDILDEQECYDFLMRVLHPEGLMCPNGHPLPSDQAPHDRHRAPIVDYRCRLCGKVFNIFTGTIWKGTRLSCTTIVLLLRGVVQGVPTLQLADELGVGYETLLRWCHRIQQMGLEKLPADPLPDREVESDEMFQNAGEKGTPHRDPSDPPRRRANKRRGSGTMENDRPPVLGIVGRESGRVCLTVCDNTQQATIQPQVEAKTRPDATVYTDESPAYARIAESGRGHATVCHSRKEWARDDDGDGVREVHCNTMEGFWTGLRNFLRLFRGVHKKFLAGYVAMFAWAHNLKRVTADFLRALMVPHFTLKPI